MGRSFVGAIGLLALLSLAGCYSSAKPALIGHPAPDFTVKDTDRTVALKQFQGQVVVLNFWGTFCPPCIEEMPSLLEMQRHMKARGVTVVAVSIDEDDAAYHQFLKDHNLNADLLTVRDGSKATATLYGTRGWPETFIIDRHGVMRRKFIGAIDWTGPEITDFLSKL